MNPNSVTLAKSLQDVTIFPIQMIEMPNKDCLHFKMLTPYGDLNFQLDKIHMVEVQKSYTSYSGSDSKSANVQAGLFKVTAQVNHSEAHPYTVPALHQAVKIVKSLDEMIKEIKNAERRVFEQSIFEWRSDNNL